MNGKMNNFNPFLFFPKIYVMEMLLYILNCLVHVETLKDAQVSDEGSLSH